MAHYDLIVIGTGSGNTIVDGRFADRRVAIVERDRYGGTCLNRGCIPSKMLVLTADAAQQADEGGRWDLRTSYDGVDWAGVQERVFGRTDGIARDGKEYREGQDHVDTYDGTATFVGERRLRVELADGDEVELTADQVVIAAGSRPVVPDVPGLADVAHHTSDTIMRIEAVPGRLAVIGGGYVGCELAHVFEALGSEVTIVESADVLLDGQDAAVSERFTALMSQRCDVRVGAALERVESQEGDTVLHLGGPGGGELRVDAVLVAVGRRPNGDLLEVEKAGVELDDAGRVVVDEHQRTTAEGVLALGDVCTGHPLKHVANREAKVVQHNLLHPDDLRATDHRFVPQGVFASPQVAAVGMTEAAAREAGTDLGDRRPGVRRHGLGLGPGRRRRRLVLQGAG